MAYTTAHTQANKPGIAMWDGLGKPVLDGFQHSCSLQKEFLLLNLVTIYLIFTFLGKVGGFAQSLGNFCFPVLPSGSERRSPHSAFHRACLHKGVVFPHNNWQLRFLF